MDMPRIASQEHACDVTSLLEVQSLLAVQSVSAAGSTGYAKRQMALLERLVASGSPLPLVVAMELHNLCELAPLIQDAPRRGHHWTLWYRQVWRPWVARPSRQRAVSASASDCRELRAELACVALGSALIASAGYAASTISRSISEQLSELKVQLERSDCLAVHHDAAWAVLDSFALERVSLHCLLGAGHAAMLLSDDPAWLPDPIFFQRALSRIPQEAVFHDIQSPSRRDASDSPDIVLADGGEFRDVGVARLSDNPSRLVPIEQLWMGIDFNLFLLRAFSEGLLTRLGEREQRTARRPRVCFVLDLVVGAVDWQQGANGTRAVSDLRSALYATACSLMEAVDPLSADVEIWFGIEAPWISANVGRARVIQKNLHGRLDDLAVMLNEVLLPTGRLWNDLPAVLAQDEGAAEFHDFDEIVAMEFSTGDRSGRDLPEHARMYRLCMRSGNPVKIDDVELDVGTALEDRCNCDVDLRIASSALVCLLAGKEQMCAEMDE